MSITITNVKDSGDGYNATVTMKWTRERRLDEKLGIIDMRHNISSTIALFVVPRNTIGTDDEGKPFLLNGVRYFLGDWDILFLNSTTGSGGYVPRGIGEGSEELPGSSFGNIVYDVDDHEDFEGHLYVAVPLTWDAWDTDMSFPPDSDNKNWSRCDRYSFGSLAEFETFMDFAPKEGEGSSVTPMLPMTIPDGSVFIHRIESDFSQTVDGALTGESIISEMIPLEYLSNNWSIITIETCLSEGSLVSTTAWFDYFPDWIWERGGIAGLIDYYPDIYPSNKPVSPTSLWSWEHSNGEATDEETQRAFNAIDGHGKISDFSYKVWNDLVEKVNDVCTNKGGSWTTRGDDGTVYLSFDDTKVNESDKTLTADKFNALRFNVGSRVPTGVDPVEKGDPVIGKYFTDITDALNKWISTTV